MEFTSDAALARSLAKLWPNRMHESNWFKNLLCRLHLHRWSRLNLDTLVSDDKDVAFCRWCSMVNVDGTLYGG
jgi:hypothetical protein